MKSYKTVVQTAAALEGSTRMLAVLVINARYSKFRFDYSKILGTVFYKHF